MSGVVLLHWPTLITVTLHSNLLEISTYFKFYWIVAPRPAMGRFQEPANTRTLHKLVSFLHLLLFYKELGNYCTYLNFYVSGFARNIVETFSRDYLFQNLKYADFIPVYFAISVYCVRKRKTKLL